MPPSLSLGSWWAEHLQLPGYNPLATAGRSHFDIWAAEQALAVCTQWLATPLSPWEEALLLNLWGWRQANGQRQYVTVYAEPYRQDALATWCATLGLLLLCMAPPRRAPQVSVSYAQASLAADAYTHVVAAIARTRRGLAPSGSILRARPGHAPRAAPLTPPALWRPSRPLGEVPVCREGSPPSLPWRWPLGMERRPQSSRPHRRRRPAGAGRGRSWACCPRSSKG